jgi:hypothetical protein
VPYTTADHGISHTGATTPDPPACAQVAVRDALSERDWLRHFWQRAWVDVRARSDAFRASAPLI